MMLLGEWARPEEGQHCMLGRVKAHVTCVLHLKMQWTCSLCGSIYKQVCVYMCVRVSVSE